LVDTCRKDNPKTVQTVHMATPATKQPRLRLPTRIRTKPEQEARPAPHRTLAERIAGLPGIEVVRQDDAGLLLDVAVYVLDGKTAEARLLCNLQNHGITVHGLDDWDRHQVVLRGWGRLTRDCVLLFTPRDDGEVDVCWDILKRAGHRLSHSSAVRTRRVSAWGLPSYSRTTLQ